MEDFLSLLESVDPLWLTPSSTTWAMDMILAFACGLGLFHLLLPLLPFDSPSPPPAESTTTKKVVKREPSKVRKRIRTVKAYRGRRKKSKEDKVLALRLHSMLERLVSFCQLLGQDVSGEAFTPDAAKAHLPPRQPTEESEATSSSLETSSAPRNGHLLMKDSKPLWHVLLTSSPTESQSSVSASWPPENLTPGRHHSPPQHHATSYPSHPLDPVACPPPMPDPRMAAPQFAGKYWRPHRAHLDHGLSSPMPTILGLNL